jgi:hypothetical protein
VLRQRSLVIVALAIAVPATAQTFGFSARETAAVCLSIGGASYRVAAGDEQADHTVRIDPAAAAPDVSIRLTAAIDEADFVFIEGSESAARCPRGKAVKIETAGTADITVGLANPPAPADYRIYVRSRSLAPEVAAALYAAAHLGARRLARVNNSH